MDRLRKEDIKSLRKVNADALQKIEDLEKVETKRC